MRIFALISPFLISTLVAGLIPKPRSIKPEAGELTVDVQTTVIAPQSLSGHANVLKLALQSSTGYLHRVFTPQQVGRQVYKRAIHLSVAEMERPESYRLEIKPAAVTIVGSDSAGLMHGVQTFAQLLPKGHEPIPRTLIPAQTIEDWPATPRRIFHLDLSAHLFPVADLKVLIDWLSFHKLNEFHLQLNGDHGWRMESLNFPKLHEIGSVRASTPPFGDPNGSDSTEYGGYLTQNNLKELVKYAQSRSIEIVPTFTFVEGASAIIASYPELGENPVKVANTWKEHHVGLKEDEATLQFLNKLFEEIATIFSSSFIRLQGPNGEFHDKIKALLINHKKELFKAPSLTSTDFSVYSRPKEAELLVSPKLTAKEGFNPVRDVFELKPGKIAQATLPTQYVPEFGKLHYLVFPRIAAFAAATWRPVEDRDYKEFRESLKSLILRYRYSGIKTSEPFDAAPSEPLGNSLVTSSISARKLHPLSAIFDGNNESFFWSEGALQKGDYLTIEFPWPINGDIEVATGPSRGAGPNAEGLLIDGVLDLSPDGKEWDAAGEFFNGLATVTLPPGTRFARIRATGAQDDPLVLHEVILSEPLLMPEHEEKRSFELVVGKEAKERIELTFRADLKNHPEFREEIDTIRRIFFNEWFPLSQKLGLAFLPNTPREFQINDGEPGELSPSETRTWFLKRWIPQLLNYHDSSPKWFATGMVARIVADPLDEPDRLKNFDGGAESAAFLNWIADKHSPTILEVISQDCRSGLYRPSSWKLFTKFTLDELSDQYRKEK